MDRMHAGFLLLLLFCSAYSYQVRGGAGHGLVVEDPDQEWDRLQKVINEEMAEALAPENKFLRSASGGGSSTSQARKVPEYLIISAPNVRKDAFAPEKGARGLPDWAKEMLLKTASAATTTTAKSQKVDVLCHIDRIYVRIKRSEFKSRLSHQSLKLGKCPVNYGSHTYYYLLYLLENDCGFKKESLRDFRSISSALKYHPSGRVFRTMPFDIDLQCKFPRYFNSYKVGFHPKLQGGTVHKALQRKSSFTLSPLDASGSEISGVKTYTLGETMYFGAKQAASTASSTDKRVYFNKCYISASRDPNSNLKYTVIDNHGCMIDGKLSAQSKFIAGSSKMAPRFSMTAVIFKEKASASSQQLYMNCDVSVGKSSPTRTSKACNYDPASKKWKELHGDDSVCACCDSTCASATGKSFKNMISSHSWKVDLSRDEYDEVEPRMKLLGDDSSLEDLDVAEHKDFLNDWAQDV